MQRPRGDLRESRILRERQLHRQVLRRGVLVANAELAMIVGAPGPEVALAVQGQAVVAARRDGRDRRPWGKSARRREQHKRPGGVDSVALYSKLA